VDCEQPTAEPPAMVVGRKTFLKKIKNSLIRVDQAVYFFRNLGRGLNVPNCEVRRRLKRLK
jgi:hypothetical protein